MATYNHMNLQQVYGGAQRFKANKLALERANVAAEREDTAYDEEQRMNNTRWLAGATKVLMDTYDQDPDRFYEAADELARVGMEKGVIDPDRWDPQLVTREAVQELHDAAMVGLGGQRIDPNAPQKPARVQTAEYYMGLDPEGQRQFRDANAARKGMKTIKVPMQDGTEIMVNYDPETGQGYDLQTGGPMIVRPGGGGQPLVYGDNGLVGPGQEVAAQPIEGFGRTEDPAQQRRRIKEEETEVTEEIKREKIVNQQLTALENAYRLQPMMVAAQQGADAWNTGWGSLLSAIPGSSAKDLKALNDTIKANIGFDRLQRMRAESPTGGALGQVAVQELVALQSTIANLDTAQSTEQYRDQMMIVMQQYNSWMNAWGEAIMREGTRDQQMRYYTMIPSGSRFMHPDGSWRVKP